MIKILIFVFALLAICATHQSDDKQPTSLIRPAPIHPDIPSDPKPKDKIIPIKYEGNQHQYKRDNKFVGLSSDETEHKPLLGPINLRNHQQSTTTAHSQLKRDTTESILTHTKQSLTTSRDHQQENHSHEQHPHNHLHKRAEITQSMNSDKKDSSSEEDSDEFLHNKTNQMKRDISVPMRNDDDKKTTQSQHHKVIHTSTITHSSKSLSPSTEHPAIVSHPIPVSELLRSKSH